MAPVDKTDLQLFERGVLARLTSVDAGYGGTPVLRAVNFEAHAGEVTLVTGPTSAGKTTLMHLLRLWLRPHAGRALILGHDAAQLGKQARAHLKRRIGYVAENPSFVEAWSAFENVALPLRMEGQKAKTYEQDVRELIEFVGLDRHADTPAGELSAAARRLAAIARALAVKPDMILADDPTSGMSPDAGRRVVRLLMEMRRVGVGVVITSQDESLADLGPTSAWRIAHGRISPADLALENYETEY